MQMDNTYFQKFLEHSLFKKIIKIRSQFVDTDKLIIYAIVQMYKNRESQ